MSCLQPDSQSSKWKKGKKKTAQFQGRGEACLSEGASVGRNPACCQGPGTGSRTWDTAQGGHRRWNTSSHTDPRTPSPLAFISKMTTQMSVNWFSHPGSGPPAHTLPTPMARVSGGRVLGGNLGFLPWLLARKYSPSMKANPSSPAPQTMFCANRPPSPQ